MLILERLQLQGALPLTPSCRPAPWTPKNTGKGHIIFKKKTALLILDDQEKYSTLSINYSPGPYNWGHLAPTTYRGSFGSMHRSTMEYINDKQSLFVGSIEIHFYDIPVYVND